MFLDGIVMKRTWAGEVRNVSLLVAIGLNAEGYREILGICEGAKEDKSGWSAFLRHLVDRGLTGVELIAPRGRNRSLRSRLRMSKSAKESGRYQRTRVPGGLMVEEPIRAGDPFRGSDPASIRASV